MNLNSCQIWGRLVRDPEIKYATSGLSIANMRIAVDDYEKGEKSTMFLNITAFSKQADFASQRLRKGSAVLIEGRLKVETWKDKETGKNREKVVVYAHRVSYGESMKEAQARGGGDNGGPGGGPSAPSYDVDSDDLPF